MHLQDRPSSTWCDKNTSNKSFKYSENTCVAVRLFFCDKLLGELCIKKAMNTSFPENDCKLSAKVCYVVD